MAGDLTLSPSPSPLSAWRLRRARVHYHGCLMASLQDHESSWSFSRRQPWDCRDCLVLPLPPALLLRRSSHGFMQDSSLAAAMQVHETRNNSLHPKLPWDLDSGAYCILNLRGKGPRTKTHRLRDKDPLPTMARFRRSASCHLKFRPRHYRSIRCRR